MLATISHQQHPIILMKTFDEIMHLARGRKRGLIEHIQTLLSSVGLHPFGKMMLESRSLHASLSKLVRCARCRRKPLDPVALGFSALADDGERRCLTCAGNTIEAHNLLTAQENIIHRFALCAI